MYMVFAQLTKPTCWALAGADVLAAEVFVLDISYILSLETKYNHNSMYTNSQRQWQWQSWQKICLVRFDYII